MQAIAVTDLAQTSPKLSKICQLLCTVLFLVTHIEYNSIDASVFVVALLGWSFISMTMSAHVSFVIAGTVPVGDMHLLASTNQKAYAASISRQ